MAQLRQDYQQFIDRSTEIIAVGPEDNKAFTAWWHGHKMPFIGIPDPQHILANLYSQKVKWLKGGRMPALVAIDKAGLIRYRHYADAMSDIPSDDEILAFLNDLNKEKSASSK